MSLYKERVSRGQCGNCGRPLDRNGSNCIRCSETRKKQYNRIKTGKVCVICRKKHSSKGVECDVCKSEKAAERHRHREKGLCIRCDKLSDNGVFCEYHYQQHVMSIKSRVDKGICVQCGGTRLLHSTRCWTCWLKQAARKLGVTVEGLNDLWNGQNGRCIYSGRPLIPGVSAHLDHKVAIRQGGVDSLDNLQWVDKDVNYAKRALSEVEFFRLVEDVYKTRCK